MIKKIIKKIGEFVIIKTSNIVRIDLLDMAYKKIGVLRGAEDITSGEKFFVENILKKLIKTQNPVLIDAGANIGEYSTLLRKIFPTSKIIAFEPNEDPFKNLKQISEKEKIEAFAMGLSSFKKEASIFVGAGESSKYGSLYKEIIKEIHHHGSMVEKKTCLTDLDSFCDENKINHIDLFKMDIEGHELEALRGAKKLLSLDKIDIIQFEFNAVHVASRVFIKDFYDILPNFEFYRLREHDLLPLGKYNAKNEIFRIQNIVAFSKKKYKQEDIKI
ncbi:MAG: FkbM family methyltransferase [Parcubacteria group bacterium]|nr:FkbM family methyltransferase [Parcubacteria group bacterium]